MKNIFIVLNYNDYETTERFINQIKNYRNIDKIIIVDNNSTDNSYDILNNYSSDKIEIIKTDNNKGYAYGNNYGIKYAEKYGQSNLIISNPDIIVNEQTINNLIDLINTNHEISALGPIIKNKNGSIQKGWHLPTIKDEILLSIPKYGTKKREKILGYKDSYYKGKLTKVDALSGCFFIIKSNIIKDVNYFDEKTFLYYEENILAYKLKSKGYESYISNDNYVLHNHSVSIDKSQNEIKKFKILKESQNYYINNYLKSNLICNIIIRFLSFIILQNIKFRKIKERN